MCEKYPHVADFFLPRRLLKERLDVGARAQQITERLQDDQTRERARLRDHIVLVEDSAEHFLVGDVGNMLDRVPIRLVPVVVETIEREEDLRRG